MEKEGETIEYTITEISDGSIDPRGLRGTGSTVWYFITRCSSDLYCDPVSGQSNHLHDSCECDGGCAKNIVAPYLKGGDQYEDLKSDDPYFDDFVWRPNRLEHCVRCQRNV